MGELINTAWYLFKWTGALLAIALLAIALQKYLHVDDEIRARVEARLASGYPQLRVNVRSARLVKGEGIEVRGVSISDPRLAGPEAQLATFDELWLPCSTDLTELARGEPLFNRIVLRRAKIRATRKPDGTWSTATLLPIPRFGPNRPPISVENATLELHDPSRGPTCVFVIRDAKLQLEPGSATRPDEKPPLAVRGVCSADYVEQIAFHGSYDPAVNRFQVEGVAEGIRVSPELAAKLPGNVVAEPLEKLRGNLRSRFTLSYDQAARPALQFDVHAALASGRLSDTRLPYPIADIRGNLRATNAGFLIEEFSAQCGPTVLRGNAKGTGYGQSTRIEIDVDAGSIRLERRLAESIPEAHRQAWYKFLPEGDIDASAKLIYADGKWTPDATVTCRNVSFSYHKFPYRLEQGKGTIRLVDQHITLRMTAKAGSQPMRINGDILNPGPQFTGWLEVEGNAVPIDDKLITALPSKPREVVRSMHPQGSVNLFARLWRDPGEANLHRQILLAFNRCSIIYDKFPYPIANIRGTARMDDGVWAFQNLVGTNDTGLITCEGSLRPIQQGAVSPLQISQGTSPRSSDAQPPEPSELLLHFAGERVPMEEELRLALPSNMQRLWGSLEPRGEVDLVTDVRYVSTQRGVSVALVAEPRGGSSIEPHAFPYRMEKLSGVIRYRDGRADLERIRAQHGRTTLSAEGQCDFSENGAWALQLKKFSVDRLRADHDLLTALPGSLKRAVTQLKPSGQINLRGMVDFSGHDTPDSELRAKWDIVADLLQTNLDCGIRLNNLFGSVRLMGSSVGNQFSSQGELALDSLIYNRFQFTEVMGPLFVDNSRVLFGAWAERPQPGKPARHVSGKLCGGRVSGEAQVLFTDVPQYALQASLTDADLKQLIRENLSSKLDATGRVLASLQLQGKGFGTHTMTGNGSIRLHDADIYELPVMVSLLKILSVRPPDATAFTKSDINFRVQGEHLLFDQINFNGDAISLLGKGQMNFDRQLDLTFHAMVGRDDANFQIPILRNVIGEASQQIMQIRVTGSCDDPLTRSEAFPGVNKALQALQAEIQPATPPSEREAALPGQPQTGR